MLTICAFLLSPARAADPVDQAAGKTTAGADWSAYKIVDIHAHIGHFKGFDLRDETLLNNLQAYKIRLALISNLDAADLANTDNLDEVLANQRTQEMVLAHPNQLRGLLWVKAQDKTPDNLIPFLKAKIPGTDEPIFVGMKFHPEFNHYSADDKRLDKYLKLCAQYHIPAVFHCGVSGSNSSPDRIYTTARRHPTVPVVLYHMGFDDEHDVAITTAKAAFDKGDAQLYLETSQADPDSVMDAIETLGVDRVLFGSDATYFGANHYRHYEDQIKRLSSKLTPAEFEKVVHGNAVRLFNLHLPN